MTESDAKSVEHMRLVRLLRPLLVGCIVAVEVIVRGIWDQFVNRFVPTNAPRGDVGRFSNADIAEGVGWHGDADQFIQAMIDAGRLAQSEEHRLVVADWHKLAPGYLRSNIKHQGGFIGAPAADGRNEGRNAPDAPQDNSNGDDRRNADPFDPRCDLPNGGRNDERNGERNDAVYPPPSLSLPSHTSPSPTSPHQLATWGEVGEALKMCKMARASVAIAAAQGRDLSADDVLAMIEHWKAHTGAWDVGALFQMITGQLDAWPTPAPNFERQRQRQHAAQGDARIIAKRSETERQQAAECQRFNELNARYGDVIEAMTDGEVIAALEGDSILVPMHHRNPLCRSVRERIFETLERRETA